MNNGTVRPENNPVLHQHAAVRSRSRPIELLRAVWGTSLLVAPAAVLARVHRARVDHRSVTIARILGVRQLGQAALSGFRPTPEVLALGIWVDVTHALSAVGLAVADRSRVRAGLVDAVAAGLWAVGGLRDLRPGRTPPASHEHRRDQLAHVVLAIVPGGRALLGRVVAVRRGSAG